MPDEFTSVVRAQPGGLAPAGWAKRAGVSVLFLICALAVFMFGPNYYPLFPTNGNGTYAAVLSAIFLVAAVLLKRSQRAAGYWQIAFAFFIAAAVNLVSILFAGYIGTFLQTLGVSTSTIQGKALAKVCDTLLVVVPILVLVKISGADLGSLYLKKGSLKWGLGIGALVLFNFLTSALIFFQSSYANLELLGSAVVWGGVFAFSNGFMEELWLRGLFLKKLAPMIGVAATVLISSLWFASIHFLSVAYLPATAVPVFLINTFTLGLACGFIILKTGSLWGAVLIHAGGDWFLFIAVLALQ